MRTKAYYLERLLQEALKESKLNTHELADISGVSQAIIWRFLNGERSITLPTASKLIESLDLEITFKPKRKRKK